MDLRTDERSIHFEPQPELAAQVVAARGPLTEQLLSLARSLAQLEATAHFVQDGCASIVEWAARHGFDRALAHLLVKAGRVLARIPQFEEQVRQGKMTFDGISLASPALLRPAPEALTEERIAKWAEAIRVLPPSRLRAQVKRELAEDEFGRSGLTEVSVIVKDEVREKFRRCRKIASRKEGQSLDEGQTFTRVVDHYLDSFDPERVTPGTRRVPSTSERPHERYVPAQVEREIRQIAGDRCEVPFCEHHLHLALCHRTPHADGSAREVDDLFLGCTTHHTLHDAGKIRMIGRDASGRARFVDADGREIGPPGAEGEGPAPAGGERAPPGGEAASPRRAGAGGDARSRAPSPGPVPDGETERKTAENDGTV